MLLGSDPESPGPQNGTEHQDFLAVLWVGGNGEGYNVQDMASNMLAVLLYLKGTMNMVAHKCPRVVSLPVHVEGSEGSVQGLYMVSLGGPALKGWSSHAAMLFFCMT